MTRRHRRAHVVAWGVLFIGVVIAGVLAISGEQPASVPAAEGTP